jgi:hypothetical protein
MIRRFKRWLRENRRFTVNEYQAYKRALAEDQARKDALEALRREYEN